MTTIDFKALGAKAAAEGVDMTKATKGGGDYVPPAEGPCKLRLIAYIEVGKQKTTYQGKPKIENQAFVGFELSGPKHEPKVLEDGTKVPQRIFIKTSVSMNEKANFFKLFNRLNYSGKAVHIAQLLGDAYKGRVVHRKYAKKGEDKANPATWTGIEAELRTKDSGWTIEPPRYEVTDENGPTGELKLLAVDPAITPLKCFLWQQADKAQWDSIFIDGEYEAIKDEKTGAIKVPAKSKNKYQNLIKLAENFKGSPIYEILVANGGSIDIPDAEAGRDPDEDDHDATADIPETAPAAAVERAPEGAAADDALAGVV